MKDLRQLNVWETSRPLALAVCQATKDFPKDERYELTSQIPRSRITLPTNIAEGYGRFADDDFARFLQIVMGSASEIEYQLILARDLSFLSKDSCEKTSC